MENCEQPSSSKPSTTEVKGHLCISLKISVVSIVRLIRFESQNDAFSGQFDTDRIGVSKLTMSRSLYRLNRIRIV